MSNKLIESRLKEASMQIFAGGSAGFVEISLMHPLDLVKTRLQVQVKHTIGSSTEGFYSGVYDCFRKIYIHEGFRSLWKGVIPPMLVETPKRALKFLTFEQYQKALLRGSEEKATPMIFAFSGLLCGVTEGIMVNPFEVVKIRLQANTAIGDGVPTTFTVTREIIKEGGFGLNGLNKGLTATVLRNGFFNMVYFGFYHTVKERIPVLQDPIQEFLKKIFIGFVAGTFASCTNIPFDVAKSRIQGPQPIPGQIKYRGTFSSMVIIAREEGFRALYKGLLPKVLRLGPGGGIMLVVYEYTYEYLKFRFPL